jgi:hypothetical protein
MPAINATITWKYRLRKTERFIGFSWLHGGWFQAAVCHLSIRSLTGI